MLKNSNWVGVKFARGFPAPAPSAHARILGPKRIDRIGDLGTENNKCNERRCKKQRSDRPSAHGTAVHEYRIDAAARGQASDCPSRERQATTAA